MKASAWIGVGALFSALAVILGAFGAHALKTRISADGLEVYQTGAHYHLVHGVAIVLVGAVGKLLPAKRVNLVGWLFTCGVVLFSGSLYCLAITDVRVFGAITPLGGLCFILGWSILAWSAFQSNGGSSSSVG